MAAIPKGQTPQWLLDDAARRGAILKETIWLNPFIPPKPKQDLADEIWRPWRRPFSKQIYFLTNNYDEVLYGGAARGGKTESLLMASLQYVQRIGYHGLILRRTYAELNKSNSIMYRAHEWLSPWIRAKVVHWSGEAHRFTFPAGSSIEFGYLANEADLMRYQSADYNFIGVDEVGHFPIERMYAEMFSRLTRPEHSTIPSRMMSATNPGGPGAQWLKARFGLKGVMEYNVVHYTDRFGKKKSRLFIGSLFTENVHIDQLDYASQLGELDAVRFAQLAEGNWDVIAEGFMFRHKWFEDAYVNRDDLPPKRRRVRGWDLAATPVSDENKSPDFTAGILMSFDDETATAYIEDLQMVQMAPAERDEFMSEIAARDAADGGPHAPIRVEQEGGSSGKSWIDSASRSPLFAKYDFDGIGTGGRSKEVRAQPMATAAKQGRIKLVSAPWNEQFLNLLCPFPQIGIPDDPVDAASLCYNYLVNEPIPPMNLKDLEGMHSTLFYG